MPVIVSFFVRQFLIIAAQLGIFYAIDKWVVPLFNRAVEAVIVAFGVGKETAHDILANEIITTAESLGITVALSKIKLPLLLAEKLGFTSKGFNKRILAPADATKVAKVTLAARGVVATESAIVKEVAETIAKTRGFGFETVARLANIVVAVLGVPIGVGLLVINTIDFAAWPSSAYTDTFQKFFAFFGLKADASAKNSKVLSEDMWKKVFAVYQNLGVVGINDPYDIGSKPFTRENLITFVDKVAAHIIAEKGKVTLGQIIAATQGFMIFTEPVTNDKIKLAFGDTGNALIPGMFGGSSTPTPKVFTGIVSQGNLGLGLVFTPRPDDLIQSLNELREAATNNLAPFLNTLLGKVVYEVKVVASIITKDGFKQTGTTQKVQTGTFDNGSPKYKTVTNKFAVLKVYALTVKNSRAEIASIVLGPTDSAKLTVGQNDLRTLEVDLPKLTTTNNLADIKNIETAEDIKISKKEAETAKVIDPGPGYEKEGIALPKGSKSAQSFEKGGYKLIDDPLSSKQVIAFKPLPSKASSSVPVSSPVVSGSTTTSPRLGASTTTLYDWFQAQGQSLPNIEARSALYAGFGLGPANYYTGTSEQNIKLLNALKAS